MIDKISIGMGILIGAVAEYSFFVYKAYKNNLYDKKGKLKKLRKSQ